MPTTIFNRAVANQEAWHFDIEIAGLYALIVKARCKNWLQNFKSLFNDDDLAVQIDSVIFTELAGKKYEFNTIGSWNGNEIKNSSKAVVFFLPLEAGQHTVTFWVDGAPLLETVEINALNSNDRTFIITPPADLAAVDLVLKNIPAEAVSSKDKNGITQIQAITADWRTGIKCFAIQRPKDVPVLSIAIDLIPEPLTFKMGRVKLYQDIIIATEVNLHSEADDNSPIVAKMPNDSEVKILEELVVGKWISGKSYVWHKIKYQNQIGYVLSTFVEIQGQERGVIIDLIKYQAKELKFDANLVLALAGCESRYKVYAAGGPAEDPRMGKGVFQLTSHLIKDLNDSSKDYYSPIANVFDFNQNIVAGVTFFKWLNRVRYKNSSESVIKSVVAYNAGYPSVPVKGKLNLNNYEQQTRNLVSGVLKNSQIRKWNNIWWPLVLFIALGASLITSGFSCNLNSINFLNTPPSAAAVDSGPSKLNIVWSKKTKELIFFTARPEIVYRLPISKLNDANSSGTKHRNDWEESVLVNGIAEDTNGMVYFLVASSDDCGAQNCYNVLYQLNLKTKQVRKIQDDVFGISIDMMPSPDGQHLTLVSTVHGGACNTGVYVDIIDTKSLVNSSVTGYNWKGSSATYPMSSEWKNDNEFNFTLTQSKCAGKERGNRDSKYSYNLSEKKLLLLKEIFRPESKG